MNPAQNPLMGSMLVPILLIYVIFYFVLIRPQRKEQQQHQAMLKSLKKNDDVVTTSGIHGTIVNVKEQTYVIRIDDNVKVEFDKNVVARCLTKKQERDGHEH